MAHYDPDRMTSDDLDFSDDQMVDEWFNHPNTIALHDDIGRQSRSEPPEIQRASLAEFIDATRGRRLWAAELLENKDSPEVRASLQRLLDRCDEHILGAEDRLRELED